MTPAQKAAIAAFVTRRLSPQPVSSPVAQLPGAKSSPPPAFSDTELAARHGATWAETLIVDELQRAKEPRT